MTRRGAPPASGVDFRWDRERMVRLLAEKKGIADARVLDALRRVPRHLFVRAEQSARAYQDYALPIGGGQTISQPYVVARMSELLAVERDDTVLEIGTGSGYQTAILAALARRVFSVERVASLAQDAIQRMRELGLNNVKIHVFDGTVGWSEAAPYQRILVTAAAPRVPEPLLLQLEAGGRLVVPEGGRGVQRLVVYRTDRWGEVERSEAEEVSFVPLIGRHGFAAGPEKNRTRRAP